MGWGSSGGRSISCWMGVVELLERVLEVPSVLKYVRRAKGVWPASLVYGSFSGPSRPERGSRRERGEERAEEGD